MKEEIKKIHPWRKFGLVDVAKKDRLRMQVRKNVANFINKKRGYVAPNPVGRPKKVASLLAGNK